LEERKIATASRTTRRLLLFEGRRAHKHRERRGSPRRSFETYDLRQLILAERLRPLAHPPDQWSTPIMTLEASMTA
jgi:hypothetical protein